MSSIPAAPAAASNARRCQLQGTVLTLDNGVTAVRLPGGKRQFAKPLAMVGDRGTAIKNLEHLEEAGLAFGPIAGIRLADGRWTGGSYFAAESIEAVRFRQKSRATEPDAATLRAALEKAPRVTGYETRVTEQGPLFVEATIRFAFDNGGYYQMTVRALAGDPALRVDEVMDLKTNCPGDDPLYVAMVLNDGWKPGGWKPDAAFFMTTRRQDKCGPFEDALKTHGYSSRYASAAVDYSQDRAVLTEVVPHDVWSERAHYFGLVQSAELRANKAAAVSGRGPAPCGVVASGPLGVSAEEPAPVPAGALLHRRLGGTALDDARSAAFAEPAAHGRVRPGVRADGHAAAVVSGGRAVPVSRHAVPAAGLRRQRQPGQLQGLEPGVVRRDAHGAVGAAVTRRCQLRPDRASERRLHLR